MPADEIQTSKTALFTRLLEASNSQEQFVAVFKLLAWSDAPEVETLWTPALIALARPGLWQILWPSVIFAKKLGITVVLFQRVATYLQDFAGLMNVINAECGADSAQCWMLSCLWGQGARRQILNSRHIGQDEDMYWACLVAGLVSVHDVDAVPMPEPCNARHRVCLAATLCRLFAASRLDDAVRLSLRVLQVPTTLVGDFGTWLVLLKRAIGALAHPWPMDQAQPLVGSAEQEWEANLLGATKVVVLDWVICQHSCQETVLETLGRLEGLLDCMAA